MTNTKTFYRVVMPQCFAGSDHLTIEEAKQAFEEISHKNPKSEHAPYWEDVKARSYIVKVTETIERI